MGLLKHIKNTLKFMQTFKKLLSLLSPKELKRAGLLLIMIIIMAFIDVIGVASILPFVAVLSNPGLIDENVYLNTMFQASIIFGVENNQQFLFALGFLVFVLLIVSLTFKALTTYAQLRFVQMREYTIGKRLVEGYMHQPYSWFLSRHSADLGKNILSEVSQLIKYGFAPLMELIAKGTVTIVIITLLILVDVKLTFIVGLSLTSAYGVIFLLLRKYLINIGSESLENNKLRYSAIVDAFGATKEVKIRGLEDKYIERFSNSAKTFAKTNASSLVASRLPRFIFEAIAFGGILIIILYLIAQVDSFNNALPIISLYVFAGYRLLPALQQIYGSFTQLTFVGPSLNSLYDDIKNLKPVYHYRDSGKLPFNKSINLKNIQYDYPNSPSSALKDINLNIPFGSNIGLVGTTGSGKTTLVDIILGLLEPQKGTLEIDDKIISKENLRSWQRSIGYVPQHIYLTDDTIAANIAFGVKVEDINLELIKKVSKIANLHEFVINELSRQYETTIGERGVRLSGGQRQRIGIARALYHNPKVLILDEATSALDNKTEQIVMDSMNNLSKNITIILISHRLNTVKNCDAIFKLEKGRLVDQVNFDELVDYDNK